MSPATVDNDEGGLIAEKRGRTRVPDRTLPQEDRLENRRIKAATAEFGSKG